MHKRFVILILAGLATLAPASCSSKDEDCGPGQEWVCGLCTAPGFWCCRCENVTSTSSPKTIGAGGLGGAGGGIGGAGGSP